MQRPRGKNPASLLDSEPDGQRAGRARRLRSLLPSLALRPILLLLLLPVLVLFALWWGARESWARTLEDWTGETELRHQLQGLLFLLWERPVETGDLLPIQHTGMVPYGANTFFEQEVEEAKLRRSLEMLRAAGVRWIRQQMPWDRIEIPRKGAYESPFGGSSWETYDRIVRLAREYDLEIVARLDLPPVWARRRGTIPQAPPERFEDYGDFVAAFAERYRDQVRYYQVWNEPNLYSEWGEAVSAERYVDLLRIGSTRIRQADPDAVILTGPLAQTLGTADGLNESDLTFLEKMYGAGAAPYFDILSVQGHGLWTGPTNRRTDPSQTNLSRLRLLREIMVRRGEGHKPIWISELGWDALPLDFPLPATLGRVTEEQQARYTVQAYQRIRDEWPWVGVAFYWHFRRVHEVNRLEVDFYYRMLDPDFTPRPVYSAYQQMAAEPPYLPYGYHQEKHLALEYRGAWSSVQDSRAVQGAYREASLPGASLAFTFKGTALWLVTARGPGAGTLRVQIRRADLPAASDDQRYQVAPMIDLRSPTWEWQVPVAVATSLPVGLHTAVIAIEEPGAAIVDGLVVDSRTDPSARAAPVIAGGVLLLGALIGGAALVLRRVPVQLRKRVRKR